MHRIYMTTNLVNGKKYVGRCSKDERWEDGYLGSGVFLKQAIKKYGRDNFKRETLQELSPESSLREAIEAEKSWLEKLNCKNSPEFYNMSNNTGGMGAGDNHSEETKKKISDKMKQIYGDSGLPLAWRENVANARKGREPWNKGQSFKDKDDNFYKKRRKPKKLTNDDFIKIKDLHESGLSASKIGLMWDVCHHVILAMIKRGGPAKPRSEKMTDDQKQKISESVKLFHKNKKEK